MVIESFTRKEKKDKFKDTYTGNSPAIRIPDDYTQLLAHIRNVTGGTATLEYSLDYSDDVKDDTAHWYTSTLSVSPTNTSPPVPGVGGEVIDFPLHFLRVVCSDPSTNYTLDFMI